MLRTGSLLSVSSQLLFSSNLGVGDTLKMYILAFTQHGVAYGPLAKRDMGPQEVARAARQLTVTSRVWSARYVRQQQP